jgi:uncharacterized membrane protein HdeD (DUF308 family)
VRDSSSGATEPERIPSSRRSRIERDEIMTTAPHYSGAPPAHRSGAGRVAIGVLGAAAVLFGGFLLFNPYSAARTLALLFGVALVIAGCMEFAGGWDGGRRWGSWVLGAILVIGGVLAAVWPAVSLGTIALIVGLSLILHGLGRLALAVVGRREIPGWGWLAFAGAVNLLVGILAVAWPQATVFVLSLVFGAQVLIFGVLLLVVAFWLPGSPVRSGV